MLDRAARQTSGASRHDGAHWFGRRDRLPSNKQAALAPPISMDLAARSAMRPEVKGGAAHVGFAVLTGLE